MANSKPICAFGLTMHPWSMKDTIDYIESNIISREINMQHIAVNAAKIVYAQKNSKLKTAINNSDLVNIDGQPVIWALKCLNYKVKERVAGVDLFENLIKLCAIKGYKPYFLGSTPEILDIMVDRFKKKYTNLNIAGYHHGYFSQKEEKIIAEKIKGTKTDMLFLGISSPKKELYIDQYNKLIDIPFTMGVGGAFNIFAGNLNRAPQWMRDYGLEWFYRLLQEPRRMWKRYLYTNILFIYYVFKEKIRLINNN